MFKEKINTIKKFVQIKSKPLNPFPEQRWVALYKVGLRGDDSLNQETQAFSTTCVSGHFCKLLELAELLFFFTKLEKATITFSANKKSKLLDKS